MKHAGRVKPVFLLVDDRPDDLVALEASLRRDDLDIVLARSEDEALALASSHDIGLAIIDLRALGASGVVLAERMRHVERSKRIPIIFIAAAAGDANAMYNGYGSGVVDVLHDPVDPRILRNKVETFVHLCTQRLELSEALRFYETFLAVLGHDLKNPLNAIVVATQLLAGKGTEPGGAEVADLVARIRRSAERMTAIIEQLHNPSRFVKESPPSCASRATGRKQGWRSRREPRECTLATRRLRARRARGRER